MGEMFEIRLVEFKGLFTLGEKLETGGRLIGESCDVTGEVTAAGMY
jgi:hypothetical protein